MSRPKTIKFSCFSSGLFKNTKMLTKKNIFFPKKHFQEKIATDSAQLGDLW